jgi:hypothetical protein
MALRFSEDGELDLPPPEGQVESAKRRRLPLTRALAEVFLGRDRATLTAASAEALRCADALQRFIDAVIVRELPVGFREALAAHGGVDEIYCRDVIEIWKEANLEQLALMVEASTIVRTNNDELDVELFRHFSARCKELEDSLLECLL